MTPERSASVCKQASDESRAAIRSRVEDESLWRNSRVFAQAGASEVRLRAACFARTSPILRSPQDSQSRKGRDVSFGVQFFDPLTVRVRRMIQSNAGPTSHAPRSCLEASHRA